MKNKSPLVSTSQEQQQFEFMAKTALLSPDEIYKRASQELIESLREDRRLERKPAGIHAKAIGDYFSVWSNTVPDGGIIIVGIEDDGTIKGLSHLNQNRLNDLERSGHVYCPDAKYETKRLPVVTHDGRQDFILLIRIYYSDSKVVETVEGSAYTRVGESKRKLTYEEIHELQIDKGQVDLEQEPSRTAYPSGFDLEAIKEFSDSVRAAAGMTEEHPDEEILEYRRLGKRVQGKFIPNVACTLLFAHDPVSEFPGCKIRFLRFDGEWEGTGERFNSVKDELLEGRVPQLIVNAEELLNAQLRQFSRLGPDGKFYTALEYPKEAWYEAIVNACVHRSYGLRNMNIFVKMFDDRLVIESPGAFPPFVTPENIYESHHPRNPHLMNALAFLKFVKCANEGTRRMRDTMAIMKLPQPEFKQRDSGHAVVRVTLRNDIKHRRVWIDFDASKLIGEGKSSGLTQDEHRAINFVAEHGSINVSQFQPNRKKLEVGQEDASKVS
jgi:ATP-dependent DNA helicase RecG